MKFMPKTLLTLAASACCVFMPSWGQARDAEIIGINFANNQADIGDSTTEDLGFQDSAAGKGGVIKVSQWNKTSNGSGSMSVTGTLGTTFNLSWNASGTWNGGSNTSLVGKLTYGYLDNADNGTQNSITLSGLPGTAYDVAIILGGDGPNSPNAQNNKFSPINVNGTQYTFADDVTKAGSTAWGTRIGADTLTEGTNVLYIQDLTTSTLQVDGYYQTTEGDAGRGTIAAIMVFVKSFNEYSASMTENTNFSSLTWDGGTAPGTNDVATITLAADTTLTLDSALALKMLTLACPDGSATITASGEGSLANVGQVAVGGTASSVDFGALTLSSLKVPAGTTAVVNARSQITTLTLGGTLRLAGGAAVTGFNPKELISSGGTLEIAKEVSAEDFHFWEGGKLNITADAALTVTGNFRTREVGGNGQAENIINQTAGIFMATAGEATGDQAYKRDAVVLSHAGGMTTYNLSGGKLSVPNGWFRGGDGSYTLNLSGNGTLEAKKFNGCSAWNGGVVTLKDSATLRIDEYNYVNIPGNVADNSSFTLAGGTLQPWTVAALTIPKATLTGKTVINTTNAAVETPAAATVTFSALTSTADAGELDIQGTGTVALGTLRPKGLSIASTAKVALTLTAEETLAGSLTFKTSSLVAPPKECFTITGTDGGAVALTAEPTIVEGVLTVALPIVMPTLSTTANWGTAAAWSTGEVPTSGAVAITGGESAETAITVTLDTAVPAEITGIIVTGHATFVTSSAQATIPAILRPLAGAVVSVSAGFSGNWTLPADTTLRIGGDATMVAQVLTVDGTLMTTGTTTLSGANIINGTMTAESGICALTTAATGLKGTLDILSGAKVIAKTGDTPNYNGSSAIIVRGELAFDGVRWSFNTNNTLTLYEGAQITGTGDTSGAAALDWFGAATVSAVAVEGKSEEIVISAPLKLRGVLVTFNVQQGVDLALAGNVISNGNLAKTGDENSHLILRGGGKTYSGTTQVSNGYLDVYGGANLGTGAVTIGSGTALTFLADTENTASTYANAIANNGRIDKAGGHAVTLGGVIDGSGPMNVNGGTLTLTAANTRGGGKVTIAAGAELDISSANACLFNPSSYVSASDGIVTVNGKLTTRSWVYGMALGALAHNTNCVRVDGGTVAFTENCGASEETATRGFTVTANGATLEVPAGVTYYKNASDSGAAIANNGTLRLTGAGTYGLALSVGGTVEIASGTALGGAGTLSGAVTFKPGAILDATANTDSAALTVNTPVFEGGVTVTAAAGALANTLIVKTGAAATPAVAGAMTVAGATLLASPSGNNYALVTPPVIGDLPQDTPAAVQTELQRIAAANGITNPTLEGSTAGQSLTGAQLEGALECFSGVVTVPTTGGTIIDVSYDFGIERLTIKPLTVEGVAGDYVVLAAKVQGKAAATAGYTDGTAVEVWLNGAKCETAVPMTADPEGSTPAAGVKWFRIPHDPTATSTFNFTVKAVSTAAP